MAREKSSLEEAIEDLGEYRDCGMNVASYLDEVAETHGVPAEALRIAVEKLWNSPLEEDRIRNADYFAELEQKTRHSDYLHDIYASAHRECLEIWANNRPDFEIDWLSEAKNFAKRYPNLTDEEQKPIFAAFRSANGEHSKCKAIYKAFRQRR